ncbi:MAG: SAM-dependent methyltransferase, partial [Prevotella sp.]|nr:SAM-dependent methyltransferase [Prevotella sp.]
MVKQQRNTLQQGEFPLPKYVRETLNKHNIPFPSSLGDGTGVRLLALQAHNYPDID